MSNNGIEDILIGRGYNTKKKKGKGIIILFFILLIILAGFVSAYWYFTKDSVSSKELFVQNISKVKINQFLNNDVYETLSKKIITENSKIDSSISFSTNFETEELKGIDESKFVLDISNENDVENLKTFSEAILNYSGNEIFKANLLLTENEIAIASNEVLDKYVGVHLDKTKDVFGIEVEKDKLLKIKNSDNIEITEDELNLNIKKYLDLIVNNIPEDNFTVSENIAIANATADVTVTNYSVELTQEEVNSILVKLLEELKADEELLKKIALQVETEEKENVTATIVPKPEENVVQAEDTNNNETNTIIQENPNVVEPSVENTLVESNTELPSETPPNNTSEVPTQNENENNSGNTTLDSDIPVITINPVASVATITPSASAETEETTNSNTTIIKESEVETSDINALIELEDKPGLSDYILRIIFGKKVNVTVQELQSEIDKLIEKVKKLEGNGLKINVYATKENVEKINITLPNDNTVDLEFSEKVTNDSNENNGNYIKITYLYEKDQTKDEKSESDGFSLEIRKSQTSANTTINAEYSFIENEKINKKIKISLKTDGTVNSKEFKNDIVVTVSTNEGELQVAIDSTMVFGPINGLTGLNSENCIYLDMLTPEERTTTLTDITTKLTNLYNYKKDNLKFIDTNTYSSTTLENEAMANTNNNTKTREEAKNALITKVGNMMQDAIDKNEEFTIKDLADLEIEGYKVSTAVTQESAIIVVDIYTFNIDKNFTLTDVE